jgi:transposase
VLVEASTESEWVARHLETLGHEVIVADPNFAPMYATRSRRTKTDRRDACTLEVLPLFEVLVPINEQIAAADHRIAALARTDAEMALLATAPSIGPITASAVVATVDDIKRFASAHHFDAFLGLVPGERSSGEKRRIGRITKAGNSRVRYLLVEAGWRILRARDLETAALRERGLRIAERRGKRIAVVAIARRLAGILYALWRDQQTYDRTKLRTGAGPR